MAWAYTEPDFPGPDPAAVSDRTSDPSFCRAPGRRPIMGPPLLVPPPRGGRPRSRRAGQPSTPSGVVGPWPRRELAVACRSHCSLSGFGPRPAAPASTLLRRLSLRRLFRVSCPQPERAWLEIRVPSPHPLQAGHSNRLTTDHRACTRPRLRVLGTLRLGPVMQQGRAGRGPFPRPTTRAEPSRLNRREGLGQMPRPHPDPGRVA